MTAAVDLKSKIGSLVCYYLEGWRYGHLEGVKGVTAIIRPMAARGSPPCRTVRIHTTDIEGFR